MTGYAAAALGAAAVFWAGLGLVSAALTLWIGGAVAVCLLAVFTARAREADDAQSTESADEEEALLAAALEQWEQDRLNDLPRRHRRAQGS